MSVTVYNDNCCRGRKREALRTWQPVGAGFVIIWCLPSSWLLGASWMVLCIDVGRCTGHGLFSPELVLSGVEDFTSRK